MVSTDGQSEFLVHLGDIVSGSKKVWPEAQYIKVANILRKSKIPVFVVLGDNEYNDLDDPALGLQFWKKHFLHFDKQFRYEPAIQRQEVRPENFAWISKGALLIGVSLPGGRVHDKEEWARRMQDDADWLKHCMRKWRNSVHAAVVMAQATPTADHDLFFRQLSSHCKEFDRPVLYLHADGHVWQVEKAWRAPKLWRVQTDQVGRNPPVIVTVTGDEKEPFLFERRLKK